MAHPPVGVCIFAACAVAKLPLERVIRPLLPFLAILIATLLLVTMSSAFRCSCRVCGIDDMTTSALENYAVGRQKGAGVEGKEVKWVPKRRGVATRVTVAWFGRRRSSPHQSNSLGDLLRPRDGEGASTLGADEGGRPVPWIGGDFGKVSSCTGFQGWSHRPV
jgi:Tripartite ATP-independent periplasmic transporter, DctM component